MDPIVEEAAAGSESAWLKIVETLGPAVRGFARARGAAEPEDVTQEVFLDAARNIAGFEGDWAAFRSWLFTIAYRRVADDHRHRARRVKTVAAPQGLDEMTPGSDSPEDTVVDAERVAQLLGAMQGLSQLEKDIVLLRVIAELDSGEVADIVGKSSGNVRVIQNRALEKLRRNFKENV